jgi:antitoxin YefM
MARETSYSEARSSLGSLCDYVAKSGEVMIIHRRGARDVALVAADELEALRETAHLLRSPKNAKRLMTALRRARSKRLKPRAHDESLPKPRNRSAGHVQCP